MERTRSRIAKAALKRYLQEEKRWLDHIRASQAAIDRGEGIPQEDVMARMHAKIARHGAQDSQ